MLVHVFSFGEIYTTFLVNLYVAIYDIVQTLYFSFHSQFYMLLGLLHQSVQSDSVCESESEAEIDSDLENELLLSDYDPGSDSEYGSDAESEAESVVQNDQW